MQVQKFVLVDFDEGLKDRCLLCLEVVQTVELRFENTMSTPSLAIPK